tara:strand:- start:98 stop:424 length:327 start_codon:yes stop_codon:yes gene_type:complete
MSVNWKKYPKQDKLNSRDSIIISKPDGSTKQLTVNALKGTPNYTHVQSSSSNTWVITHNLNKFPSVTVVDSANTVVIGTVVYNSNNQLTITFFANQNPSAFEGKAYLN